MQNSTKRTVSTETFAYTTHVIEIDLSDLLGGYDVLDRVVLDVRTPSGRNKRVAFNGSFLVAQEWS